MNLKVGDRVRVIPTWYYSERQDFNHPIVGDTGVVTEANPNLKAIRVNFDSIEEPWFFDPYFLELMPRNESVLKEFTEFCQGPGKDLRFWQALRAWSGYDRIVAVTTNGSQASDLYDTFFWEGRRAPEAEELKPLTTEEKLKSAEDRVKQLEGWLNEAATELGGVDLDQVASTIRKHTVPRPLDRFFELKNTWLQPTRDTVTQNSTAEVPGNTRR